MTMNSPPNFFEELHADIFQRLQTRKEFSVGDAVAPQNLSAGIEQEFFLLNAAGEPASPLESQNFLSALGDIEDFHANRQPDGQGGEYIAEVCLSFNQDNSPQDFAPKIKYDHHPHLMEISSAPQRNLHDLQAQLQSLHGLVDHIAQSCGLTVSKDANLDKSAAHPSLQSTLPAFQNLRFYRGKILERHNPEQARDAAWLGHFSNYAAAIAATHVHIGGLHWWDNREMISQLYCYEPELLFFSSIHPGATADEFVLSQRWNGYKAVFEKYPLVGFPQLDEWTMQSWQHALLNSPLAGGAEDAWAALSVYEYGRLPADSCEVFWKNVRDLQIIRPRLFGTLEFRADPAQPSLDAIMGMAALRLGLCCHILTNVPKKDSFATAREQWWNIASGADLPCLTDASAEMFSNAYAGLKSRQLGEEKYLQAAFPEFVKTI